MGGGSPRFRRDLQATSVEAEGVQFVEVTDARSGKSFRFYDFEHTVALALDGRPLEAVADDLKQRAELELSPDQLASFADQLEALGFLENGENGKVESAGDGFFPPLTAHESGAFQRPEIVGGPDDFNEGEKTPTPEPLPESVTPGPVVEAAPAPPPPAPPPPVVELEPPPPPPPPAPAPSAPRFQPLRPPAPSEPAPAPFPPADLGPVVLGPSPSAPAPALRASNGTHASGEIEVQPPPPRPPPSPAPEPIRAEPLRLVPKPRPAPAPLLPPPVELVVGEEGEGLPDFSADMKSEVQSDPQAEMPPELRSEMQPDPEPEPEERPLVFNTGAPIFPVSPPLEDGHVQRLEVSMTRRFITPDQVKPSVSRKALMAYGLLGVGAVAVVVFMVMRFLASDEPPPVSVQVVVPSPTSVYRWWDKTATVQQTGGAPLAFTGDGRLAEVVPAGTKFVAGDTLAMLESGKVFRGAISHNKSRLAYYEQMRETMTQQENKRGLRDAELKIAEKKRLIAEAQEAFAKHAIVAVQPGEVSEALVNKGASIKAGEPALKLKSSGIRAQFELPKADADKARQLGFCRAEIDGKPLECSLAAEGGDDTHVAIELPVDPTLVGKTVRLARDRLDAVFAVPLSALVKVGESDRLYVVSPSNRAEMRVVAVADRGPTGATVTQGLDVGDRVIVQPANLKAETRVLVDSPAR